MNLEETFLIINEKIINDDLLGAVKKLEKISKGDYHLEFINLQSRIVKLSRIEINKTESAENIDIERNNIRNSLLKLIEMVRLSQETTEQVGEEIHLIEELARIIEINFNTWKAQSKLRDNLVDLLENRIEGLSYETKYDLLANYYSQLTERELRLHKVIRGYTEKIIYPNNISLIELLKKNSFLKDTIKELKYLEQHLRLWKSKYESIFINDESVCLIYVGIEEGMRFPPNLLDELKEYISNKKK